MTSLLPVTIDTNNCFDSSEDPFDGSFAEGGEECDTIREDISGNGSDSLGSTTTGNEDLTSEDLRRDTFFLILITFCGW